MHDLTLTCGKECVYPKYLLIILHAKKLPPASLANIMYIYVLQRMHKSARVQNLNLIVKFLEFPCPMIRDKHQCGQTEYFKVLLRSSGEQRGEYDTCSDKTGAWCVTSGPLRKL